MPSTPLGRDVLRQMLSSTGRVVLVNRSSSAANLTIIAAAIVRHNASDVSTGQTLSDLDLTFDESEWVDPPAPITESLAMVEVFLRLSLRGRILEKYVCASSDSAEAPNGWEAGVEPVNGTLAPTDVLIDETPGLVAYIRPFS
jgi:hypothetical protein